MEKLDIHNYYETSPAKRKAWARLIQKIHEVDPLTCPKCTGAMKKVSRAYNHNSQDW